MAYEDFTGFTEFDEGGDVTVDSATKVSWAVLRSRFETAYLYKDKGVDHFSGDFTHKFEVQFSGHSGAIYSHYWMLANSIGDAKAIADAGGDALTFFLYGSGEDFYLRIFENGGMGDDDYWNAGVASTTYYVEIVRDDDGGVNNTGRLTAYIRTGSHSGALQDTLIADCAAGEQNDFRYLYAVATYNDGGSSAYYSSGFTQNLDIGEAPAGWTGKISGVTNPAKINGVAVANITSVMGK